MAVAFDQCVTCKHLLDTEPIPTCKAFPRGLPADYWTMRALHDKPAPFPDKGLVWQGKDAAGQARGKAWFTQLRMEAMRYGEPFKVPSQVTMNDAILDMSL